MPSDPRTYRCSYSTLSRSHTRAAVAVVLASLVFSVVFIARTAFEIGQTTYFALFDDAMISMRYARNFAGRDGLVWNPGEAPVEGYTNLLWTLVMAVPHALGVPVSKASLTIMVVGAFVLAANIVVVGAIARRLSGTQFVPVAAMVLTAASYPLVYWTLRGMEVGLASLLISLGVLLALRLVDAPNRRDRILLAAVVCAGVLTRTDLALPLGVILAYLIWAAPRNQRLRNSLLPAAALVASLVGHTIFRLVYYGEPLPNTYYLKLGGVPLTDRLVRGISAFNLVEVAYIALPLWLAVVLVLVAPGRIGRPLALLAGTASSAMLYSIYVGGDAWEWMGYPNRYVTPALPLVFILGALGLSALLDRTMVLSGRALAVLGAVAAVLCFIGYGSRAEGPDGLGDLLALNVVPFFLISLLLLARQLVPRDPGSPSRRRTVIAACAVGLLATGTNAEGFAKWVAQNAWHVDDDAANTVTGISIRNATSPETSIAVVAAGAIPYFAERRTIDLLGKNDPVIARGSPRGVFVPGHNKWDYSYSIGKLSPDVVVQLWRTSPETSERIRSWGYRRLGRRVRLIKASVDPLTGERLAALAAE